jgi:HK97 family phage major capsid protein
MNARAKVYKNEDDARRAGNWFAAVAGDEYALRQNVLPLVRAASEGVNSAGGFLVPAAISDKIIELRDVRGIFRSAAGGATPMNSDADFIPRRVGGLTAYFTQEAAAITESSGSWDNVNLVAKKLAALTRSSAELTEDSAANLGEVLTREIAYAFAGKEDDCGFNGDGTSTYGGIRGVTRLLIDGNHGAGRVSAVSGHDTFAEVDTIDLTNLIGATPSYALPGAKWFVSPMAFALVLCRLASSNGGICMMEIDGRLVPTFWGFEIKIASVLPAVTSTLNGSIMLLFGDLSLASTVGERKGISIRVSSERLLDTDQLLWRGTERIDVVNHDLGDASVAGPIVGLMGN